MQFDPLASRTLGIIAMPLASVLLVHTSELYTFVRQDQRRLRVDDTASIAPVVTSVAIGSECAIIGAGE